MTSKTARIAIGSILTECNQFGGQPIDLSWFDRYDLYWGEQMLQVDGGVVGGGLQVLREAGADIVPLLSASTCPGAYITADCYARLRGELLGRLSEAVPVEGVLLLLHGASVADGVDDPEGDLITAVRDLVGPQTLIVGTLDLHAHVTAAMVAGADALVAWETYPHSDTFGTGQRGARLLLDSIEGRCRPTMVMAKVPVLTSGICGATAGDGAFARHMRFAKECEGRDGVLSTSVFLVHPYLDQPDLGSGGLVVTDGDPDGAEVIAREIAARYWASRFELEPEVHAAAEAVALGLEVSGGPVILVETADCAGGGASGDSVATLKALLDLGKGGAPTSLVPVVDPEAAAACHAASVGEELSLVLGHQLDPRWGVAVPLSGRVARLSDGLFRYQGGVWDGVQGEMGPSAVLEVGQIHILITTHATYDWADEQWRAVGLNPLQAKFVVAKNPMNFHNVYGDAATAVFILDTPGPTPATLRNCSFKRLKRPFFPVDQEIPGLQPVVLRSASCSAA
ncbi:MAG: M81 family metallopeptidase [Candidatus Latescibacterota bacterium]|nr:M81 family metallopeptidase [Candidatus Latescibacterota bacterium]